MMITQEIRPLRGMILAERLSEERVTASGLYIVPTLKKGIPAKRVKILAMGAETWKMKHAGTDKEIDGKEIIRWKVQSKDGKPIEKPWHYKVGDVLYVKPHVGIKATINGKECLFLRRGDVIGVANGS